jgi:hypothetical protein
MSMWEMVIYLVVNFMAINITVRFAECFLKNNIRSRRWRSGGIVIYWLINSLVYLFLQNDTCNLLTSIGGVIFIVIIAYNGSILKRIMAAILALSMRMASETIIWYIFTPADPGSQSKLMMNIVSVLMYFGLQLLVDHFCHLKKGDLASEKYYLLIMVFPFLSIWFIYLLFADKVNDSLVLFGILFIILILNFFLFYLYNKIYELGKEKYEKQLLKEEIQMYERRFETMQQSRDRIRALRHDLLHHLQMLQHFALTGNTEQLVDYIGRMNEQIEIATRGVNTGNDAVDAILDFMIEKAKQEGAVITVKSSIPKEEFISIYDINILLSNLLDNAIEGVKGCSDKEIHLNIKTEQGLLCICVENQYDGILYQEENRYLTRKNEDGHGIGLQNVSDIVDKYHGIMKIETENHIFKVNLILYL